MRKINTILGPVLIILLLIHAISGSFQLTGLIPGGSAIRNVLSITLLVVTGIHGIIGVKLTVDTFIAGRHGGRSPFKNNELFWIKRITGFAIVFLVIYHVIVFSGGQGEVFRLNTFEGIQLAAHIILTVAVAVHVMAGIKPLCMALGIADRRFVKDALIVLSVIMLVCAVAFVYYYLRWNVLWKFDSSKVGSLIFVRKC